MLGEVCPKLQVSSKADYKPEEEKTARQETHPNSGVLCGGVEMDGENMVLSTLALLGFLNNSTYSYGFRPVNPINIKCL